MVKNFLFKDRDGQTPLPPELMKGLKINTVQTMGELDEYEEQNIGEGLAWLDNASGNPCDHQFWLKLHAKLFGDVWSWAGQRRVHDIPFREREWQVWSDSCGVFLQKRERGNSNLGIPIFGRAQKAAWGIY